MTGLLECYTAALVNIAKVKLVSVEPSFSCYNLTILQPILKILASLFVSLNGPSDDTFTVR